MLIAIPLGVFLLFSAATGRVDLIRAFDADDQKIDRLLEQKAAIESTVVAETTVVAVQEQAAAVPSATPTPTPAGSNAAASLEGCEPSGDGTHCLYTIAEGDSLASIAERFGLNGGDVPGWELIFESNKLDLVGLEEVLEPGWVLRIPVTNGVVHLVLPGDSLTAMAETYDVSTDSIVAANGLSDPDNVQMGDILLVPSPAQVPGVPSISPMVTEEATGELRQADEVVEDDDSTELGATEDLEEESTPEREVETDASEDEEENTDTEQEQRSQGSQSSESSSNSESQTESESNAEERDANDERRSSGQSDEEDTSEQEERDEREEQEEREEREEREESEAQDESQERDEREEQDEPEERDEPEEPAESQAQDESEERDEPAEPAAPVADDPNHMSWPVVQPLAITNYMTARHPLGMDFGLGANPTSSIMAAAGGTVEFAGGDACCSYGYYVIVDHGNGLKTLYAHLSTIAVRKGETVSRGQSLGIAGNTGYSRGVHLHFEVYKDGTRVDPMIYLPGN